MAPFKLAERAIRLRALIRSNELFLIPLALIIGVIAGVIVTLMSEVAQLAHVVIYGIPIDVHLSANATIDPLRALAAPALGGLSSSLDRVSKLREILGVPNLFHYVKAAISKKSYDEN